MLQARRCGHRVLGRAGSPSSGGVGGGGTPGAHRRRQTRKWPRCICQVGQPALEPQVGGSSVGPTKSSARRPSSGGRRRRKSFSSCGLGQGHGQGQQQQEGQVEPALEDARRQGGLLQLAQQAGQVRRRGSGKPCPSGRAHVCQKCLSDRHRSAECPQSD